jgi:pilus assembly protein CpaB
MNLPKGIIFVVMAGVVGLLATFGIHRYVSAKTKVPVIATSQVPVAAGDISPGTALNGSLVKMVSWPKELIPPGCPASLSQLDGRVASIPVAKGEPILMTKLAPEGTAAGLSGLLGNDKRALTVRVDDVSGVAGFIHPGDKVDVLADLKIPGGQENFSKTILQNILVLTAGQVMEQKGGDSKPVLVNTVTLELTPDQAEVLNLASNEGKIRMALRSRSNMTPVVTAGVSTSHLISGSARKEVTNLRKEGRSVEVIKGLDRSKASL